jgi:hypothetical protein
VPPVDGCEYSETKQLLRLLFRIGFIVGRRGEVHKNAREKWITFEDSPELPDVFPETVWEISPCYRGALRIR